MKIKEILINSIKLLEENNVDEARLKARTLLSCALNKDKTYLVINDNQELSVEDIAKYNEYIDKLIKDEPLQYIIGTQEFMKLNFKVNKNVLIPRQDTEILVEEVIEKSKDIPNCKILDLCTGSGVIAISLKKYMSNSIVIASDISCDALKIAKENAKLNNINIELIQSNLFDNILNQKFDIIVSNPPYIESEVVKTLDKQVRKEPQIALDGGQDGLDFYRAIINNGYRHINKNGYLCLEIGYDQKEKVIKLIKECNKYKNIYSKKDLAGNNRIVVCQKN